MMKKNIWLMLVVAGVITTLNAHDVTDDQSTGSKYTVIIEGYDWGPAVSKVVLPLESKTATTNVADFKVNVIRSSSCNANLEDSKGERNIIFAYVSNAEGVRSQEGTHITLVLAVGPDVKIGAPMQYFRSETCRGTMWVDYTMTITHHPTKSVWDTEGKRIQPILDKFDLTGSYTHGGNLKMSYAAYDPKSKSDKVPLLIWLHGGGEGGTDPSIPLLGNKATNYASKEIQEIFKGAYVLVPQCPGAWMHNAKGVTTHGAENDVYNEGLMALIKSYVSGNPKIDKNRIYIGGCSNGGYMTLKLMLLYPDYFAAGFISSLAYQSEYISDQDLKRIANKPIWFMHSAEDKTTLPDKTVLPVYKRLLAAGAKDVHLSYYDHVVDITGFFGGDNYYYNGHHSWIYCHANLCTKDFDGTPVTVNGWPVTIMEWLSNKSK